MAEPRSPKEAKVPRERTPAKPGQKVSHDTILLVDDEVDMRTSLAEILVREGYQVLTVGNGQEALECLRRIQEQPALILLDLVMPVMDGWTFLTERARDARLATTPVFLISGQADAYKAAAAFALAGCIGKPIEIAHLLRTLREFEQTAARHP